MRSDLGHPINPLMAVGVMMSVESLESRIIQEAQWLLALLQISALFSGMGILDA
jgi:hypothetical protein